MPGDEIDYTRLFQKHMRGMVKDVLGQVASEGLPGEHHFYVTFLTTSSEVKMPEYLRARYPETMTIVIQHQFRDLTVTDSTFELCLSFGGKFEYLCIPYGALVRFTDPHGGFDLPLLPDEAMDSDDSEDEVFDNLDVLEDLEELEDLESLDLSPREREFLEDLGGVIDINDPGVEYLEKHNPLSAGSSTDSAEKNSPKKGASSEKASDEPARNSGMGKVIKVDFGKPRN